MKKIFNSTGKYNDFYFDKNYDISILIKKEIPIFYNKEQKVSNTTDKFWQVVMVTYYGSKNYKYNYNKIMKTYFYLNPNMTKIQLNRIIKTYINIPGFSENESYYYTLYNGRKDISRNECCIESREIILNPIFDEDHRLYVKKFEKEKTDKKIIDLFYKKLSNYRISYSYLANELGLTKYTIKKRLNSNNIYIRKYDIEYTDPINGEIKNVINEDQILIETKRNINFLISNRKFITNNDIIKITKLYDEIDNEIIKLSITKLKKFYNNNPEYKNKVKEHNIKIKDIGVVEEKNINIKKSYYNTYFKSNKEIIKNKNGVLNKFDFGEDFDNFDSHKNNE